MGRVLSENSIGALLKNDSPNHFYLRKGCGSTPSWAQSPRVPDGTTTGKNQKEEIPYGISSF